MSEGLRALLPVLILTGGSLACLLLEVLRGGRRLALPVALTTVALAAVGMAWAGFSGPAAAGGIVSEIGTDLLSMAVAPALVLGALGALLLGRRALVRTGRHRAEFESLVLASLAGAFALVQARDLLMLFLGLETLSIPLYVLAGFVTDRPRSVESALKYFTVGAFSSAFVAFGIALAYGCSGSLSFAATRDAIAGFASAGDASGLMLARAALAFLLVGFGFKIAAVPFHAWAPDVYQGAPTPITAFLGVTSKAAAVAGLVRLLAEVFVPLPEWASAVALLAVLTLVVGNCVALVQEDMKRLLAYSGVSHVGYLLLGVVAITGGIGPSGWRGGDPAIASVAFYLGAYSLMTLGAFAVVALLEEEQGRDVMVIDFAGLSRRRPVVAAAMLILLLSLGGIPPLAGFVGKLLVFLQAVRAGWASLAILAAATSVMGFYYYLRPVLQMYLRDAPAGATPAPATSRGAWLLIAGAVLGVVLLGAFGGSVLGFLGEGTPVVAQP